jgi:hypothetical protein
VTFSLLPDCFASRVKGQLIDIEKAADQAEHHEGSLVDLAVRLRPTANEHQDADHVDGLLKWIRRRRRWVIAALTTAIGLLPEKFAGRQPTLADFRAALGVEQVLVTLRGLLAAHLRHLPPPLGFGPRSKPRERAARPLQHEAGQAPPDRPS